LSAAEEIDRISARLREIAERLRSDGGTGESADELAREAADLVTRAGNELDRATREPEPPDDSR
jgi:hypothetical protein